MFSVRSVFSRRPFFYKLSFFGREENFLNQAKHICETCTLCQPETHLIILSAFTFTKNKNNVFFFSKLFRIFCRNNIQGNLSIMIIKILVMSTASLIANADKKKDLVNLIRSKRLVANADADNGKGSPLLYHK